MAAMNIKQTFVVFVIVGWWFAGCVTTSNVMRDERETEGKREQEEDIEWNIELDSCECRGRLLFNWQINKQKIGRWR